MENLLEIKNVYKKYPISKSITQKNTSYTEVLKGIDLSVYKGEILAIAGESGCGKTTLGKCVLRLETPDSGEILYKGNDIYKYNKQELNKFRSQAQMIFQNPYASLNPKMTVFETLQEPLILAKYNKKEMQNYIEEISSLVGLSNFDLKKYPHEFSGGQRQRIAIARALVRKPEFIVADEPVSALDVSIQAQIINLLLELKNKLNLTMIFVSHDLSVIKHISTRVAIMQQGKIVELGLTDNIYSAPQNDYTKKLLSAIPSINNNL